MLGGIDIQQINLEKLREFRMSSGQTYRSLAELLNLGATGYYKKEVGERKFTIEEARVLSKHYNTSIETLFFNQ